jgi:hypothetical protein
LGHSKKQLNKKKIAQFFQAELLKLLADKAKRIERVCLVDRPVDYPFLPDGFFSFMVS